MTIFWQVLYVLLWFFVVFVWGRIIIEFTRMFARNWRPVGGAAVTCEVVYVVTDPPVKLLRRLIPTVRLGGVGFDLSIIVLLIALSVAQSIVLNLAFR